MLSLVKMSMKTAVIFSETEPQSRDSISAHFQLFGKSILFSPSFNLINTWYKNIT